MLLGLGGPRVLEENKARKVNGKSARHIVTHYMLQEHYDSLADCAH